MNVSIIISIGSTEVVFENFLSEFSKYKDIFKYELIFINDNPSFVIANDYLKNYGFIDVILINNDEKSGYGVSNNKAVSVATNEYILLLNDDIILKENCIEFLRADLEKGIADAVQPKLIFPQNKLIQSTGRVLTNFTNAHAFENRRTDDSVVNISNTRQALTTAVCAFKKSLFLELGGFDDIYYNAWEGLEFTLKLSLNNYKCMYNHKAEAYHIRGGARGQYSLDETYQSGIFWSRWYDEITSGLESYIINQLETDDYSNKYTLINFSKITKPIALLNNCNLNIKREISFTYNSGLYGIDFFKILPPLVLNLQESIIYFVNNFTIIKNNLLWFEKRKVYNDMIIDLSGNVIKTNSLLPNSSL